MVEFGLKTPPIPLFMRDRNGAENGSRTRDLRITSASLYQLSYLGIQDWIGIKGLGTGASREMVCLAGLTWTGARRP